MSQGSAVKILANGSEDLFSCTQLSLRDKPKKPINYVRDNKIMSWVSHLNEKRFSGKYKHLDLYPQEYKRPSTVAATQWEKKFQDQKLQLMEMESDNMDNPITERFMDKIISEWNDQIEIHNEEVVKLGFIPWSAMTSWQNNDAWKSMKTLLKVKQEQLFHKWAPTAKSMRHISYKRKGP